MKGRYSNTMVPSYTHNGKYIYIDNIAGDLRKGKINRLKILKLITELFFNARKNAQKIIVNKIENADPQFRGEALLKQQQFF